MYREIEDQDFVNRSGIFFKLEGVLLNTEFKFQSVQ